MKRADTFSRPRVVIVGAGFAGIHAARVLGKAPVQVTVIDRNNYHKFQPLLYQVATAGLEPDDIAHNARRIFRPFPQVNFRLGTVRRIDAANNVLELQNGDRVGYDYLILAAGGVTNYFNIEGVKEHGFPLKNLPDALHMRNHILHLFERADRNPESVPEGAFHIVIVGGGATGVEMAGALVELFDVMHRDFSHIDTRQARVILLEMGDSLLPSYPPTLREYTYQVLVERGVDVRLGATVSRVTEEAVFLKDGEVIPTQTLIWAAGIQGSPVAKTLGIPLERGGRLAIADDLHLPDYPNIFVAGDLAAGRDEAGNLLPQVAQVAMQQGRHAARQILRSLEGKPLQPFVYTDYGQMATIGRHAAVADFAMGLRVKGILAWAIWAFLHIAQLIGFRNRAHVFINWIYNYFTYDRSARLLLDMVPISEEAPYEVEDLGRLLKQRIEALESPLL